MEDSVTDRLERGYRPKVEVDGDAVLEGWEARKRDRIQSRQRMFRALLVAVMGVFLMSKDFTKSVDVADDNSKPKRDFLTCMGLPDRSERFDCILDLEKSDDQRKNGYSPRDGIDDTKGIQRNVEPPLNELREPGVYKDGRQRTV